MGVKEVRLAKGQPLYRGRPKFSIEDNPQVDKSGYGTTGTNKTKLPSKSNTPTRIRPFKSTNGDFAPATIPTPSPKAAEDVDGGKEGLALGRKRQSRS